MSNLDPMLSDQTQAKLFFVRRCQANRFGLGRTLRELLYARTTHHLSDAHYKNGS